MWLGIHLVRTGKISHEDLVDALERQVTSQAQIGHLAVSRGLMTVCQVKKVLLQQAESQLSFGQIAVNLGYLSERDLADILLIQSNSEPPLWEILEDMGVLSAAEVQDELVRFRNTMAATLLSAECDYEFSQPHAVAKLWLGSILGP